MADGKTMWLGGTSGTSVFFDQDLAREFNSLGQQFRQETGRQFPINLAEFVSNPAAVRAMVPELKLRAINPQLSDAALNGLPRGDRAKVQRELYGLAPGGLQLSQEVTDVRNQRQGTQQHLANIAAQSAATRASQFPAVQTGLDIAQAMARIEPGRITTPQFNVRANTHNFGEFMPTPNTGVVAQPGDAPMPTMPTFQSSRTGLPRSLAPPALPSFSSATQLGDVGPSQQQLVSTVQNGLRLGKGIKGRSY